MSKQPRPMHCTFGGETMFTTDDEDHAQHAKARLALDMLFYQRTRGKYGTTNTRMEALEQTLSPEVKTLMEEFAYTLRHEVF